MENGNTGIERISEFSKKFSVISTYLGYKKFSGLKPKVLFFNSSGWIVSEVHSALKSLDIPIEVLNVSHLNPENKNLTLENYLQFHKELIKILVDFKPDCILTINHAAFDSIGLLTKILDQFKIPFISWFVDSPLYIFKNPDPQRSKFLYLFSWEKSYVDRLKELQFENVFYLPLATGHEQLSSLELSEEEDKRFSCDCAFVGNSNKGNAEEWFDKEFSSDEFMKLSNLAIEKQITVPNREMRDIIRELDTLNLLAKFDMEFNLKYEAYCILRATEIYRDRVVNKLSKEFDFKIFGDEEWLKLYPDHYYGKVDYYKELPKLYKKAKIIINVTSFQMVSAVNQRVFDVFSSGGFLISDYREDYDLLFGKGVIPVYKNPDDLTEIVKKYLADEEERKSISESVKQILKKKHNYRLRLIELFEKVKNNYHE